MKLTAERVRHIFSYDPITGIFLWENPTSFKHKKGRTAGGQSSKGYWSITVDGKKHQAARLAWLYHYGEWPGGVVDHKDGDKSHNWVDNLRDTTQMINTQNRRTAACISSTGVLGVFPSKRDGRFRAVITVSKVKKHLGYFNTASEAGAAYLKAKRSNHEGCTI